MTQLNIFRLLAMSAAATAALSACTTTQQASNAERQQKVEQALHRAAEESEARGDTQRSLSSLESVYKRNSADQQAALDYAKALRENGRLQRAAIVLGPFAEGGKADSAPVIAEYGAIQTALGNEIEGEKLARRAILIDSKYGEAYHVLGVSLDAQGQHDKAEVAFRKALDNGDDNPASVLNDLGLNLAAQSLLDEAVETLRRANELEPGNVEIERNLRIVTALQQQSPSHGVPAPVPNRKPVS